LKKNKQDFHWVHSDEPHATRRREILRAHPEIKELFAPEPLTAYIVLAIFISQIIICSWISTQPWWIYLLIMYVYGGTVNHSLQLANHEISHNLAFHNLDANMLLGIFANLATGVPSSVTFRMYHMDHHQYQGVDVLDTDIPTLWEIKVFRGKLLKLIWMIEQCIAYGIRPVLTSPKNLTKYQVLNGVVQIIFDLLIIKYFGIYSLLYLIGGSLIGLGLHPTAGHFIAEHYEFVKGYETYSYYGPCNYLNFNVGYHNEHHDFPRIPWSRLPLVRKIAPEWYNHLPHHNSYVKVIWNYITSDEIGPWSRVKRGSVARQQKKE